MMHGLANFKFTLNIFSVLNIFAESPDFFELVKTFDDVKARKVNFL